MLLIGGFCLAGEETPLFFYYFLDVLCSPLLPVGDERFLEIQMNRKGAYPFITKIARAAVTVAAGQAGMMVQKVISCRHTAYTSSRIGSGSYL